jgi:hypothetical protein
LKSTFKRDATRNNSKIMTPPLVAQPRSKAAS